MREALSRDFQVIIASTLIPPVATTTVHSSGFQTNHIKPQQRALPTRALFQDSRVRFTRPLHLSVSYPFQKEGVRGNSGSIACLLRFRLPPGPGALESETTTVLRGKGELLAVTLPRILLPELIPLFTGLNLPPTVFSQASGTPGLESGQMDAENEGSRENALLATGEKDSKAK